MRLYKESLDRNRCLYTYTVSVIGCLHRAVPPLRMADQNRRPPTRLTKHIRNLVCIVNDKEMFRVHTFRAKSMAEEDARVTHGEEIWASVERLTSKATRDRDYEVVGGVPGHYAKLEEIVSELYVIPFIDNHAVHPALTESTEERGVFLFKLATRVGRGKGKGKKRLTPVFQVCLSCEGIDNLMTSWIRVSPTTTVQLC